MKSSCRALLPKYPCPRINVTRERSLDSRASKRTPLITTRLSRFLADGDSEEAERHHRADPAVPLAGASAAGRHCGREGQTSDHDRAERHYRGECTPMVLPVTKADLPPRTPNRGEPADDRSQQRVRGSASALSPATYPWMWPILGVRDSAKSIRVEWRTPAGARRVEADARPRNPKADGRIRSWRIPNPPQYCSSTQFPPY